MRLKNENLEELYSLYEEKMQGLLLTKDVCDVRSLIIKKTKEININLTNEQKSLLQDLLELEHARGSLENKEIFIFAFSLAIKLIFAGLIGADVDGVDTICRKN